MKETTANAPGTNAEYAAQLARKIHEPYEHVLAAVEFYGRDPIRIKRFLFEKSDDGIICQTLRQTSGANFFCMRDMLDD